jgi:hypothetical protein
MVRSRGTQDHFDLNGNLVYSVFDTVAVRVETTVEFPLDLKCSLMFSKNDMAEFKQRRSQQDKMESEKLEKDLESILVAPTPMVELDVE